MQMLGAFAEYEREMVKDRTRAGLKATHAQGCRGGRRPKLTHTQRTEILSMLAAGRPAAETTRFFQTHRATINRLNAASRQTGAPRTGPFTLRSKIWLKIDRPCTQAYRT